MLYAAYWQDNPHDSFTQLSPSDVYSIDHDVVVIQVSLGYRAQCKLPLTGLGVKNLRSDWCKRVNEAKKQAAERAMIFLLEHMQKFVDEDRRKAKTDRSAFFLQTQTHLAGVTARQLACPARRPALPRHLCPSSSCMSATWPL